MPKQKQEGRAAKQRHSPVAINLQELLYHFPPEIKSGGVCKRKARSPPSPPAYRRSRTRVRWARFCPRKIEAPFHTQSLQLQFQAQQNCLAPTRKAEEKAPYLYRGNQRRACDRRSLLSRLHLRKPPPTAKPPPPVATIKRCFARAKGSAHAHSRPPRSCFLFPISSFGAEIGYADSRRESRRLGQWRVGSLG